MTKKGKNGPVDVITQGELYREKKIFFYGSNTTDVALGWGLFMNGCENNISFFFLPT